MDAENGKSGIGSVASVLTNLSSLSSIDTVFIICSLGALYIVSFKFRGTANFSS